MNLQDLRYFVALAHHKHFGRAAEFCRVSQPTLSGQIRKLEEELGLELLERTNKHVEVTLHGRQMLVYAQRILAESREMEQLAYAASHPLDGPLRLGVVPTLGATVVPLLVEQCRSEHPHLTLLLREEHTHELAVALRDYQLDAALVASPGFMPELAEIELFDEPWMAVLPASHALAGRVTLRAEDLASDTLLLLSLDSIFAAQVRELCGGNRFEAVDGRVRTEQLLSPVTLIRLIGTGCGFTLLPALAAAAHQRPDIVLRPLEGAALRTVRLLCRKNFHRPEVIRALERTIRQRLGIHGAERRLGDAFWQELHLPRMGAE